MISGHPRPNAKAQLRLLAERLERFRDEQEPLISEVSWQVARMLKTIHHGLFDPELSAAAVKCRSGLHDHNESCRFKYEVGRSIGQYIHSLRLQAVIILVAEHRCSISDAAQHVGYRHLQTFYRAFERCAGMSPGRYMHNMRDHIREGAESQAVLARPNFSAHSGAPVSSESITDP